MRRVLALLPIFAVVLVGCTDLSAPVPTEPVAKDVPPPLMKTPSDLYLCPPGPTTPDTKKLKVGDTSNDVTKAFPEPKSAFEFRSLPPGFASHYSAWGYNSPELSFGVIYYAMPEENGVEDRVALAMTTEDALTNDEVLSTEKQYADDFGDPYLLPGKLVRYWFWHDGTAKQSFMLCAVASKDPKQADHYQLTAALGDEVVMQALRMGEKDAKNDRKKLENGPSPQPPPSVRDTLSHKAVPAVQQPPGSAPPGTAGNLSAPNVTTGGMAPPSGATSTTTGDTETSQTTSGTTGAAPGTGSLPSDSNTSTNSPIAP